MKNKGIFVYKYNLHFISIHRINEIFVKSTSIIDMTR